VVLGAAEAAKVAELDVQLEALEDELLSVFEASLRAGAGGGGADEAPVGEGGAHLAAAAAAAAAPAPAHLAGPAAVHGQLLEARHQRALLVVEVDVSDADEDGNDEDGGDGSEGEGSAAAAAGGGGEGEGEDEDEDADAREDCVLLEDAVAHAVEEAATFDARSQNARRAPRPRRRCERRDSRKRRRRWRRGRTRMRGRGRRRTSSGARTLCGWSNRHIGCDYYKLCSCSPFKNFLISESHFYIKVK
jgi:hypothetical protein